MNAHLSGLIIGGLIPSFIFGVFGFMQKVCMRLGMGIGPFFVVVGGTVALVGLCCSWFIAGCAVTIIGGIHAVAFGLLWSLGISLILLAVSRFGANISQLAPLYNTNTLITVVLGLLFFAEWKEVQTALLLAGTMLIVVGTVIVAPSVREPNDARFFVRTTSNSPTASKAPNQGLMNILTAPVIIGGLVPALVLGVSGILMKTSMNAGLGIGAFLVLAGGTMAVFGLVYCLSSGKRAIDLAAGFSGFATGVLWSVGTGMVLLALGRFGVSVSHIAPLYNMNTLVVVLLGLLIFSEWKHVRPVPLLIGAILIIIGAALVSRA